MNVTEDTLHTYIELFHSTLEATASRFMSLDDKSRLLHIALLPAKIIGYVSTQFGAGIEYQSAKDTEIEIVRGSARVEDLFVQATIAARSIGPMFRVADGTGEYLGSGGVFKLGIQGAFPFRLHGEKSSFRIGDVAFSIGQWHREVVYAEIFGNRQQSFWSAEQAVSRAKDEVLAAVAEARRAEAHNLTVTEYIADLKKRTVLVLGDYDEQGTKRLRDIAAILATRGYDPVLIQDLPDQPAQDLAQKVATFGFLARFVVVDDSSRSGHLLEVQLCKSNGWVTILLRKDGRGGSWMTAGASISSNVILEKPYDSSKPKVAIEESVLWAEKKITELELKFDATYPWRK